MTAPSNNHLLNRAMRQALQPGAGIIMPGAGNALAARVIEVTGHSMLMVSGAAVANSYLGVPDIGLVSLSRTGRPRGGDPRRRQHSFAG